MSCSAMTNPIRISVLTTLINSIHNNLFVTMPADSKNLDKKSSFHLWLMRRKPPPPAKFSKERTKSLARRGRNQNRKRHCTTKDAKGTKKKLKCDPFRILRDLRVF